MNAEQELERYLVNLINDPKASATRRDKAAASLAKLLGTKRRAKAAREPKAPRENNATYVSKKRERADAAVEVATSPRWADLIPRAAVVPIKRGAA